MYTTWLGVAMLAALMTLRHRITQTGANSLESYFQPRMLAFALGAWAIAAYLRGRSRGRAGARRRRVRHSSDDGAVVRDLDWRGVARVGARMARAACRARGDWLRARGMGGDARPAARPSRSHGSALGLGAGRQGLHLSLRLERLVLARQPELSRRRAGGVHAAPPARRRGAARDRTAGRRRRARRACFSSRGR